MASRLRTHGGGLRRQLDRLYATTHDVEVIWQRAEDILRARATDRPAVLRALDCQRQHNPDWFVAPDMIGYSTYVDRFAGTLKGVEDHIGHLSALGVRYLHLLGVLRAREGDSDGGFAVADYLSVEPRLGTMHEFEALTAALRDARISLCVDLALNHTADQHAWAKAAQAGDPFYRDFYIVMDPDEAFRREAELSQVFPATAPGNFTFVRTMKGCVWTTFYPYQWDLNWANPEVLLAILDTMLRLANHGVEAFRLDSIAFLWKAAGTDCRNRPEAHYIVRALRAALAIVAPAVLLKAEAIVPTRFVAPYFGEDEGHGFEPECHLVYNNSLMVAGWVALTEQSVELPNAILKASGGLPKAGNWVSYARCHDEIGWATVAADLAQSGDAAELRLRNAARFLEGAGDSWARGEPFQSDGSALHGTSGMFASLAGLEAAVTPAECETAFRRIMLLNALSVASGGLALIYMGDELGLLNDRSYLADPLKAHEGRWLHRPQMHWTKVAGPWSQRITADLLLLRNARVASGYAGAPQPFDTGDARITGLGCGYDRVLLNFSEAIVTFKSPIAAWKDRLKGSTGHAHVTLNPWDTLWLEQVS